MNLRDVEAVLWKKVGKTAGNALLGRKPVNKKGETTGSGNTFIEVRSTIPLEQVVKPGHEFALQESSTFAVKSGDGSLRDVTVQYNRRGRDDRTVWRFINQNRSDRRPAEWNPGNRLPTDLDELMECYLLLIRDRDGNLHARVVLPGEISGLPVSLAEDLRGDTAGIWRP